MDTPKNLPEILRMTEEQARAYLEHIRWPDGPVCPHCGQQDYTRLNGKAARPGCIQCNFCRKQFTVTVGTIFERSHIPLCKWIAAFHMVCAAKKGVSALQLQRELGLGGYKTAWHMAHRIRHCMQNEPLRSMLKGVVEVDETYIGGKPRKGDKPKRGRSTERKTPVVALVERKGNVRTRVVPNVTAANLKQTIRDNVEVDATIVTDEWPSYRGIGAEYAGGHHVVQHSIGEYVRGDVHTQTAESFFALMKRGINGAFHHVSKKHLPRYCDEFTFRWDRRKVKDHERTTDALKMAEGKRLAYKPVREGA